MIQPLNYPKIELKLTRSDGAVYVWCVFRKRKLLLTPEEWVRQHVLHFLVNHKNVPIGLIASEYPIEVNKLTRRCDGVVFGEEGQPVAIVECKAPEINIAEAVFHQIAQYNFKLRVEWLIMTNGLHTVVAQVDQATGEIKYTQEIPDYSIMLK